MIIAVLFGLAVKCGINKLKIAIRVVDVSADFLATHKRLLAVPFVYYIILFIFFVLWLGAMISIQSMQNIKPHVNDGHYIPF